MILNLKVHQTQTVLCSMKKTGYCGGDIVMRLIDNLPKQKGYKLVFDNYFNFIQLLTKLKEQEIWAIGTFRADRMRQCKLKTEKELMVP